MIFHVIFYPLVQFAFLEKVVVIYFQIRDERIGVIGGKMLPLGVQRIQGRKATCTPVADADCIFKLTRLSFIDSSNF